MARTLAVFTGLLVFSWVVIQLIDSASTTQPFDKASYSPDASVSKNGEVAKSIVPPRIIWMDLGTPREKPPRPKGPTTVDEVKQYGLLGASADALDNYLNTLGWSAEQSGGYRHETGANLRIETERGQITQTALVLPPTMASPDVQVLLDVILGAKHSSPVDLEQLMMEGVPVRGRMSTILGLELTYSAGKSPDGFQKPFLNFELRPSIDAQP